MNSIARQQRFAFVLALTLGLTVLAVAQNRGYSITDLGAPPGLDTGSSATAINNAGTVVGNSGIWDPRLTAVDPAGRYRTYFGFGSPTHALLWKPSLANSSRGTMIDLGALPSNGCIGPNGVPYYFSMSASAVNDTSKVVGGSSISAGTGCLTGIDQAVIFNNGAVTGIGAPSGFITSAATGLNDAGQIVGWATVFSNPATHPWLYDGTFHDLGLLPGFPFGSASAINQSGLVVGTSFLDGFYAFHGFLHLGSGPLTAADDVGTLGGSNSQVNAINTAGLVVGTASLLNGAQHAFLLAAVNVEQRTMTDLGTLNPAASSNSGALGINVARDVVGYSDVGTVVPATFPQHAVLWKEAGSIVDLNQLISRKLGWELIEASAINDSGQIVGTGLLNVPKCGIGPGAPPCGQLHAYLLNPEPCAPYGGDTDGDGLCDDWENKGFYPKDENGNVLGFVDLPAMGAKPNHKDIFVQADFMTAGDHTHKPKSDAMAKVIEAFAKAPVLNPDGTNGVNLHVDCGPNCIMNSLTGERWGNLSLARSITEIDSLGACSPLPCGPSPGYDWTAFEQIKQANFSDARSSVFHYMVFVHDTPLGRTGAARSPGSDFLVSLGSVGTILEQAGTFMHELGHNLGLDHGGNTRVNDKPNYLSVMNYLFDNGLIKAGREGLLDFSRFGQGPGAPGSFLIPDLNEHALNETIGLNGGPDLQTYGTKHYCPMVVDASTGSHFTIDQNANGPIDWNCNGDGGTQVGVAADINGEFYKRLLPVFDVLSSFNDWDHLIFDGGEIGGLGQTSVLPLTTPPSDELTPAMASQIPHLQDVAIVSPGIAHILPGASLNLSFTIFNRGRQADTYSLTTASTATWWTLAGVPSKLTLAAGGARVINVPVNISGCTIPGTEGLLSIKATSLDNPLMLDSGDAVLTVSSNPGFVAVPNVVGQNQAAAQAAIVSAALVVGGVVTQPSNAVAAGTVISQAPAACGSVAVGSSVGLTISSGPASIDVPNVVGRTQPAATITIAGAGLTLGTVTSMASTTVPEGEVISESPSAGTSVAAGSSVNLVVSLGSHLFQVPNVVGLWQVAAAQSVTGVSGNFAVTVTRQASAIVADGNVISQNPVEGSLVAPGSTVSLVVSSGASLIVGLPNVVGQRQGLAENVIYSAGLAIGSVTTESSLKVPPGYVISQQPSAGALVAWDTSINLVFSSGPPINIAIPDVVGRKQTAAVSILSSAGLSAAVTTSSSATLPVGTVISQDPNAGNTLVAVDAPVNLVVSSGVLGGPTYRYLSQFGESGSRNGQFDGVTGIAIDPASHDIVVTDGSGRVQLFNPAAGFHTYFGGYGSGNGLFVRAPGGVAIDPVSHHIVVIDKSGRVLIFDSTGMYLSGFGSVGAGPGQFNFSQDNPGVAIDPTSHNIVVADTNNNRVQIFDAAGVYQSQFGEYGGGDGQFGNGPTGIAINSVSHDIVVADSGDRRVQIFNSAGVYQSQFGCLHSTTGSGGFPGICLIGGDVEFYAPVSLAIDPVTHNIVVGEVQFPQLSTVQIFNSTGVYQGQFGGWGIGKGQTEEPLAIAIDPASQNILVADTNLSSSHVDIFMPAGSLPLTTTGLTSSKNPSVAGHAVTFTATISGDKPSGTVRFQDGVKSLGAAVNLLSGTAMLTTSTLALGMHSITAVYGGDTNNAGSTSPVVVQTVNSTARPHGTSLSLKRSPTSGSASSLVNVIASLMDISANPPIALMGQSVDFVLGSSACSATSNASGIATCAVTAPAASGMVTLTANYAGNVQFLAATDSIGFRVTGIAQTTIAGNITAKTGRQKARSWAITLSSSGPGAVIDAQITGLTLIQTSGPICTPVRISPTVFPLAVGDIPATGSLTGHVTIDFTSCSPITRFRVDGIFMGNRGVAVAEPMVRYNQYQ